MSRSFRYETPKWGARLLCTIYFSISVIFFFAYFNYETWANNTVYLLKYFLALLSVVFLIVSLKPGNSRGWVYFSADDKGLYFPLGRSYSESSTDLFVPWAKVGEIKSEMLYNRIKGVSLELLLSDDQLNHCFKEYMQVNKILGFDYKRNGYHVIAYANNLFQTVNHVVEILNQLKNKYTLSSKESGARMRNPIK